MSIKYLKDGRQTVRYSSELYDKLKEKGWTIQKLLDWAIEQNIEISAPSIKVKKEKSKP